MRRSPRSEAADEVVRGLAAGLDRAIATKAREPIPGFALFSYSVTALGGAAMLTIWVKRPIHAKVHGKKRERGLNSDDSGLTRG